MARAVTAPFRHLYWWVRGAPRWMQAVILLLLLGTLGAGGYYVLHTRVEARKFRRVHAAWAEFDAAVRSDDEPAMRAALDQARAANPSDGRVAMWQKVLDTNEGDPGNPGTVYYSLIRNLQAGRMEDAAREARKRLALVPQDWLSRCVLASAALARQDPDAARHELDQLPPPEDRRAAVDPGGLLMALKLYRAVDRDTTPLRAFARSYVLPFLRTQTAQGLSPTQKTDLIECYLETFDPADHIQPVDVVQGWAPASKLADLALEEALAANDAAALARVGRVGTPLALGLRVLRHHKQVDDEQYAGLNRELEDRTRRAWEALREKEPTKPESYRGLAELHWRTDTADGRRTALETVIAGLEKSEDSPQLYEVFTQILKKLGAPMAAWTELSRTAEREPDRPYLWVLAADAAMAADRRDLALKACEKIRARNPASNWAAWTESRIWLDSGHPRKALDLLAKFGEETLAAKPASARAYTQALTEANQEDRVAEFLARIEKETNPDTAIAALAGWVRPRPVTPTRARQIADRVERLLLRWPDNADLFRIRAEALFHAAEAASPPWEPSLVNDAVLAAERLRAKFPDDSRTATWLGWLRLARDNPEQALREVAPLRTPEAEPDLSVSQLELLGTIHRRTGKPEEALRLLERAAAHSDRTAGVFIQLALVYHDRGQPDVARQAMAKASQLPRTPREQADYVAAVQTIRN